MKWEVFIPPQDAGSMQTTVTVEAGNWLEALNTGLKQLGEQGDMAANVMCDVREDGTINVTDYKTRRVFQLKNIDQIKDKEIPASRGESFLESRASMVPGEDVPSPLAQPASAEPAPVAAPAEPVVAAAQPQPSSRPEVSLAGGDTPPTPAALLDHKVFFTRDEDPGADSNLVYRERLISATGGGRDEVESLLRYYYETLKRQTATINGAHYINIALYPVEFTGRPPGPPTCALSWQDWKDPEPHVSFPAEEPAKVETSYIPPAPAKPIEPAAQAPALASQPPPAMGKPAVERAVAERAGRAKTVPAEEGMSPVTGPNPNQAAQASAPTEPPPAAAAAAPAEPHRRSPSEEMHIGRQVQPMDTGEILAEVFEGMQDLFMTQSQDEAADFTLKLAMNKIPAEAGSVFLADINTRELYFAAVAGPTADKLKGKRLHMTKGIVGFAARRGAAIAISDVRKDPRFCNEFDQNTEFVTKSVVCAPVQYEGRSYGAVEILNRMGSDSFTQGEVNVISYIATQLAEYIATSLPSAEPDFDEEDKQSAAKKPAGQKKKLKPKTRSRGKRKRK